MSAGCDNPGMATTTLLCTDGSELSLSALRQGLALLRPADHTIVLHVAPGLDPALVTGTGFAGGVMSVEDKEEMVAAQRELGNETVADVAQQLELPDAELMVVTGDAGHQICLLAETVPASVVVIGTHGRSGIKRAVMGSTSDYVVRHAVCPVLVQGAG